MYNRISVARLEELLVQQYNKEFSELAYIETQECSFEDKKFLEVVDNSVTKKEGYYEIQILFHQDNICLPNNRNMAEQRALSLNQRFKKDETFWKDYTSFMNDDLVTWLECQKNSSPIIMEDHSIIHHHGIYHKRKKTIWMVFDCTSTCQSTFLNCCKVLILRTLCWMYSSGFDRNEKQWWGKLKECSIK